MRGIFITGTDTGVGKTVVTGCLARYLRERGKSVITQKWVQCGSPDISRHLAWLGTDRLSAEKYLTYILPYAFKAACSPHLAAEIEHQSISSRKIKRSFEFLRQRFDCVLVEGAGGALVPFNRRRLLLNIARDLGLAALVVARNKLGCINHTLLTIEALKARKIKILGIVFNHIGPEKKPIAQDNPRIVRELSGEAVLGILPWEKDPVKLYKKFLPIGNQIWKKIA